MQKIKHSRMLPITGLLLGMLVWLANNGNPPTGKSAAPFDGNCNDCHSGGNFNGNLTVTGFPATANPGATYDITVSLANATGSPSKAGLQLVVVDANNANWDFFNIFFVNIQSFEFNQLFIFKTL